MQHLDEGTIHAWLDGALAPDESRRVEAHAEACESCSALVAEARGLIAASSRILTALDNIPAGVIPLREGDRLNAATDDLAMVRAKKAVAELSRRRRWWRQRQVLAVAGVAFVAIGSFAVMQRASSRSAAVPATSAMDRLGDTAVPPTALPAPVPSPAIENAVAPKANSSLGGATAGVSRDGRAAREENAALRDQAQTATGSANAPQREAATAADRLAESRSDAARLESSRQRVQSPVGATQANVPAAPAPVQQQGAPRQAETVQQSPPPLQLTQTRVTLADSVQRLQRAREADLSVSKALAAVASPALYAGCYQIRPAAGERSAPALLPRAIALDSVVAIAAGDSGWYQARSLDLPPAAGVELSWRPAGVVESGALSAELLVQRGQLRESVLVTVERAVDVVVTGAPAVRRAESRAPATRPATSAIARLTDCPRR